MPFGGIADWNHFAPIRSISPLRYRPSSVSSTMRLNRVALSQHQAVGLEAEGLVEDDQLVGIGLRRIGRAP